MPWRSDFVRAFLLDPHTGFSGYPTKTRRRVRSRPRPRPTTRATIEELLRRNRGDVGEWAVVEIRNRIGFKYERVVGESEYMSQKEAAELLGVEVMTVSRWVRGGELSSRKRNGFSVVRLRDLLKLAAQRGLKVRRRGRLFVLGAAEGSLSH